MRLIIKLMFWLIAFPVMCFIWLMQGLMEMK